MLVECIVLRVELFSPLRHFWWIRNCLSILYKPDCRSFGLPPLPPEGKMSSGWAYFLIPFRSLCVDADVYGVWRRKRESTGGATGLYGRNRHFDNSFVCESASCQRRVYGREHIEIRWSKSCFQTTTTTIHAASLFPLNGRPSSQMTGIVVMGRHCCCSLMCDIIDDHRQLSLSSLSSGYWYVTTFFYAPNSAFHLFNALVLAKKPLKNPYPFCVCVPFKNVHLFDDG